MNNIIDNLYVDIKYLIMNKKIDKSEEDLQYEKVLLRDAKHFFDIPQSTLNMLVDNLPSPNLYELKQLSISDLTNMLGSQTRVKTVIQAMNAWHLRPKNYVEPYDIMHYDNTGSYYHIKDNGEIYYPNQ